MTSNALTIVLFLLASALLLGVEAVKTGGRVRYAFGAAAAAFVLLAFFWVPLASAFPVAARQVASVAQDPSSWFILLVVVLVVAREFWRSRTADITDYDWPGEALETTEALWSSSVEMRKALKAAEDLGAIHDASITALRADITDLSGDLVTSNTLAESAHAKGTEALVRADAILNSLSATNHMVAEDRAAIAELTNRLKRIDERFAAMAARIRLDYQEGRMNELDALLYFPKANGIREVDWNAWERRQKDWLSSALQWADLARPYAADAREVIEHTPPSSYYGDWSFADSDLPDANTIHKYKTFCIMRRNFAKVKDHVDGKVMVVSFG